MLFILFEGVEEVRVVVQIIVEVNENHVIFFVLVGNVLLVEVVISDIVKKLHKLLIFAKLVESAENEFHLSELLDRQFNFHI